MSRKDIEEKIWDAVEAAFEGNMPVRDFASECFNAWRASFDDQKRDREDEIKRIFIDSQIKGP